MKITIDFGGSGGSSCHKAPISKELEEFMEDPANRVAFQNDLAKYSGSGVVQITDPVAAKNWSAICAHIAAKTAREKDWYGVKSFFKKLLWT